MQLWSQGKQSAKDGMSHLEGAPRWRRVGGPSPESVHAMRSSSERHTAESRRMISEADRASRRMQQDICKRLEGRIRDIQFLRQELECRLEELLGEIDALTAFSVRVEKALQACSEPLRVTLLCLEERTKRAPVEQECDEVERELLREREVFEDVASLLRRTSEQIVEQIRLNRSAKYYLEKDLKDKFQAQNIDSSCALMANHSFDHDRSSRHATLALPSMVVSPEEWENFSWITIAKAEQEKANSSALRALVDSLLEETATDMQRQIQATASVFQLKIQETKTAKAQMEDHLSRVLSEFASQERNLKALLEAVAEKEIPLGVAQARLSARARRPGTEQCHDAPQARLISEVQELTAYIDRMREAEAQSQTEQRNLIRCQLDLQENIEIKANSLYVDEVICTQLREHVMIHNF